jgi:Holliday junction resolvasome RuvABC endonuclease subunit
MTVMLFIDPGTASGFAVGSMVKGTPQVVSGDWDLSRTRFDAWAMTPIKLKREMEKWHRATQFEHVGYEQVRRHMSTDAAHLYGALIAAIQEFCLTKGILFESVGVGTLKKFWTGSGNATKPDMIRVARERGFEPDTDNEADALAGWHWLQAQAQGVDVTEPLAAGATIVMEGGGGGGGSKQAAE